MHELLLVTLAFEYAVGKCWVAEAHIADASDLHVTCSHFAVRRLIANRIAEQKKRGMRLRTSSIVSLPMSESQKVSHLQFVLVAERGLDVHVDTDSVLAFPANDLRSPEKRFATYLQMKVDAAVAAGYRPTSHSFAVVNV